MSHKLTLTGKHLVSVEAGLGAIHEVPTWPRTSLFNPSGRGALSYKYVISKDADFQNQSGFTLNLGDSEDWRFTNATALTATLNTRFSMKLSYNIAHLNTPPVGKKKTDATAAAALVAKF